MDVPHSSTPPWQQPVLELLCDLLGRKTFIIFGALLGFAAGIWQLSRTPAYFRSTAVGILLPREKPITDTSVNVGTLRTENDSAVRADSGTLMLPPNPDLYIELIFSRALLESLADRFGPALSELAPDQRSDENIAALRDMLAIKGTEEGMLSVTVTARNRTLAADIANAILTECESTSKSIERQLVLQQAGYLDRAVITARESAHAAQDALVQFSLTHKLFDPGAESTELLRLMREATGAREASAAKLEGLLTSRTERDPEVRRLRAEIAAIDQRLRINQDTLGGQSTGTGIARLIIEHEGLKQQLRVSRDILGTLEAQSNIFRLRAEQPAGSLAIIRSATPASAPAGPSKKQTLGVPTFGGIALGLILALLHAQYTRLTAHPHLGPQTRSLIDHISPGASVRKLRLRFSRAKVPAP